MLRVEQHDPKIPGSRFVHSPDNAARMLRESPLHSFARRWWIDQGVEESGAILVGQDERVMRGNRPPRRVRECGHAEIRQLAAFELRRPFDERLRGFIDPKAEPFFPDAPAELCCHQITTFGSACTSFGLTFQDC
jgi:hypothetical protein